MALPTFGLRPVIVTSVGAVQIDVAINQVHTFPSRITENPVEDGTLFSDHVILLPAVVEIEGRISDSSVSLISTIRGKDKAEDGYRELVRLQRDREPFSVVTGLEIYDNMLLEELSVPRNGRDGKSIRFVALLREVQIVGRDVPTNRDLVAEDVRHTALPSVDMGVVVRLPLLPGDPFS